MLLLVKFIYKKMLPIVTFFIIFVRLLVTLNYTESLLLTTKNVTMGKLLSDFKLNTENPFAKYALVQIGRAIVSRKVLASNKDEGAILKAVDREGQILGNTVFMRNKTVDEEQFAKFFFAGFKAFFDLKPASIKVFGYILNQLKPNDDSFRFYVEECMAATGYTKMTIYRALGELCAAEIIARGKDERDYYINPMVVFNGDRVTFATTFINKNYPKYHTTSGTLKGTIDVMSSDKVLPEQNYPTMDEALFPDGTNPIE